MRSGAQREPASPSNPLFETPSRPPADGGSTQRFPTPQPALFRAPSQPSTSGLTTQPSLFGLRSQSPSLWGAHRSSSFGVASFSLGGASPAVSPASTAALGKDGVTTIKAEEGNPPVFFGSPQAKPTPTKAPTGGLFDPKPATGTKAK